MNRFAIRERDDAQDAVASVGWSAPVTDTPIKLNLPTNRMGQRPLNPITPDFGVLLSDDCIEVRRGLHAYIMRSHAYLCRTKLVISVAYVRAAMVSCEVHLFYVAVA